MATWRRTTYKEYTSKAAAGASPMMGWANDSSRIVRILDVPWSSTPGALDSLGLAYAVEDFLGYATVKRTEQPDPNAGYISRVTPHYYADFYNETQSPFLYATKISNVQPISFVGKSQNDTSIFKTARLTVEYETLLYEILEDADPSLASTNPVGAWPDESKLLRYVTILPTPQADYVSLGIGTMKFAEQVAAGAVVQFAPGKILVNHDFTFRWELVPKGAIPSIAIDPTLTVAQAAVEASLGKVNDAIFAGYPVGTLLLLAAAMTPIRSSTGRRIYTVEYRMKYFNPGHHKIFGPKDSTTGAFVEISSDGTAYPISPTTPDGKHVYDVANFSKLFRPPKAPGP